MISQRFGVYVLACLFVQVSGSQLASCQESTRAWWNPFSSESKANSASDAPAAKDSNLFTGSGSPSMFKLPDWELPSWSKKPNAAKPKNKNAPSTLSRMGSTTKHWWDNTVDFINPFDAPVENPLQMQGYQPQNLNKQSKSRGPFDWFQSEEPEYEPVTVNEFLKQPPVRF